MSGRVDAPCWFRIWMYASGTNRGEWSPWKRGTLRAWTTDYDEGGQYPVAVVEDHSDSRCVIVRADQISFATDPSYYENKKEE